MLFNSAAFLVFAAVFFVVWPIAKRSEQTRWGFLVAASFVFYGWWDWRFLLLIVFSGLLDFYAARGMAARPHRRRLFLAISLLGNLGSLCAFKYSGFIARNIDALLGTQVAGQIPPFMGILPVGISFYTFQSLSYTIDVYRGELEPTESRLHFFAYLAMFPQLVAGPIVRAQALLPQLRGEALPTTEEGRFEGMRLIAHGYFKKVVIADNLGPIVDSAFAGTTSGGSLFWWLVMTCFAFQIYCDFSGYTSIARGLARFMGYDFGPNFNHPYTATSLRDFWRRWHMSLSTWFRDYVYVPLGGSRRGATRGMINMAITMVVSGLWHGAAWTFVLWGALHAVFLALERVTRLPERLGTSAAGRITSTALVLLIVWVSWVFFRATSLEQALEIVQTMFAFRGGADVQGIGLHTAAVLALIVAREVQVFFGLDPRARFSERGARWAEVGFVALVLAACVVFRGPGAAFIYFQF